MRTILLSMMILLAMNAGSANFWLGADISGTTELEAHGIQLCNAHGEPRENTELMRELGLNAVRLRVWVDPKDGFCSPVDVLVMALRARRLGMAVMIDFHYSDWWADPAKQNIPQAWRHLNYDQMRKALADHTWRTLQLLKTAGIDVRWVQVGNETTHGMLWDVGRAETNMAQYAGLTQAGYDAVKLVYPEAQVIVHLDGGCDPTRYHFIFDGLKRHGARWDMIGLSVYPYWDREAGLESDDAGTLRDCIANINALHRRYGTETMIVETGYEVKRPDDGKRFMRQLIDAARTLTGGHCQGVFYWAPELEGHYPLGAFKDHRPTAIMDAFRTADSE